MRISQGFFISMGSSSSANSFIASILLWELIWEVDILFVDSLHCCSHFVVLPVSLHDKTTVPLAEIFNQWNILMHRWSLEKISNYISRRYIWNVAVKISFRCSRRPKWATTKESSICCALSKLATSNASEVCQLPSTCNKKWWFFCKNNLYLLQEACHDAEQRFNTSI